MTDAEVATVRSIDVEVSADPESCAHTVAQLAALAEACRAAGLRAARQATLDEGGLGGLSAVVYRHSCTLLAQACDRLASHAERLARALADHADRLTDVRRRLDEVVTLATPHLTVAGGRVWSPARPPSPDDPRLSAAWAAWHQAVEGWRSAKAVQAATERDWVAALGVPVAVETPPSAGGTPGGTALP